MNAHPGTRAWREAQAMRALAALGWWYAKRKLPADLPFTEFVPPEAWVTAANRRRTGLIHRVGYAVAVWENDQPWFGARTMCGRLLGYVDFHVDAPEHLDEFCDACLLFGEVTDVPVVYRLFDGAGDLLYVGCTENMGARVNTHQAPGNIGSPWWPAVRGYTLTEYPTYDEAFAAETVAIRTENPRFNIGKAGLGSGRVRRARVADALTALFGERAA